MEYNFSCLSVPGCTWKLIKKKIMPSPSTYNRPNNFGPYQKFCLLTNAQNVLTQSNKKTRSELLQILKLDFFLHQLLSIGIQKIIPKIVPEITQNQLKKFMILFVLHVPWVFYLAFVGVRNADTHLQPNLYHYFLYLLG